eukprot:GFUD01026167.1.p1 GENE.GFUD01026167.1~~GFUD01026167.1.p1  ORF type:complete len:463 (-),score=148.37 GFUD01026167.1:170-1558(-)
MVKVISQETFDGVVKENMEEFEMELAEAVEDAKEQFEKQGINLSNIVISEKGSQVVVEAVQALFKDLAPVDLVEQLKTIRECCKDNLAQRVLATNNGAYSVLVKLAKTSPEKVDVLKTLSAVMDTNPDHLEMQGVRLLNSLLDEHHSGAVAQAALDLTLTCCVRHEANRVALVASGLLDKLGVLVEKEAEREVVIRVCRVWIALVQDDDVRVPFGKAHDTARNIVENYDALKVLTRSLTTFSTDLEVLNLCLAALASLSVRNEYCQEVVDEGGLQFLHDILIKHTEEVALVTRSLTLLKVLAGNDRVKGDVGKSGGIPLVVAAVNKHMAKPATVEAGCGAITAITLREPDNSKQVMECDGATTITTAMEIHMKHTKVQGAAAAAIRNIVSRDTELSQAFIDRRAEDLLNEALSHHGDKIGDTLRSALRDLGLKVELQERWVGDAIKIRPVFEESPENLENES